MGGYAFGDSALAARRLGLLADLFEPASRPFLARFADRRLELAVDLGCGTGHTTRLLASVLAPAAPWAWTSRRRSSPWPPRTRRPRWGSPSTT